MSISSFVFSLPTVEELLDAIARLDELGARVDRIGTSSGGRPIYSVDIGSGDIVVFIVATQHGSEPAPAIATTLFLYRLLKDDLRPKLKKSDVLSKVRIIAVPLANPDGYAKLVSCMRNVEPSWSRPCIEARYINGRDPNRDWLELTLPEVRAIHALLTKIRPHIVLDLHEFYAKGGCPPRWPHETEGFDAYVTDTPYLGVSSEVMWVSYTLAKRIRDVAEAVSGWSVKLARPNGIAPYPPIYLGTHAPLEGSAKILVESWGVGLGNYLLTDRVSIHLEAIAETVIFAIDSHRDLLDMVEGDRDYDMSIGRRYSAVFHIRGRDLGEAKRILESHGVEVEIIDEELRVRIPNRVGVNRIALSMLSNEFFLNKALPPRKRYTLEKLLDVSIETT